MSIIDWIKHRRRLNDDDDFTLSSERCVYIISSVDKPSSSEHVMYLTSCGAYWEMHPRQEPLCLSCGRRINYP